MTKKLLSILLCVTMILTSFVTVGFADDSGPARISFVGTPVTSFDDYTVTVPVAVGGTINLDNISQFTATYSYDQNLLKFTGVESGKMTIDDSFVNIGVPGRLRVSWFANKEDGRPAVTKEEFSSGGAMFSLKFKVITGMGTTDVTVVEDYESDPQIHSEIGDDNNKFIRLNTEYAKATVELSNPQIIFGEVKYTDGEIRIPVSLDRIPYAVSGFFSSFYMEYSFDHAKLTYVRTDDGILRAKDALAGSEYAQSGKISYANKNSKEGTTDGDISSGGVMFTLVFKPTDPAAATGETSVFPVDDKTEIGNSINQTSSSFIGKGATVDLSQYKPVEDPLLTDVQARIGTDTVESLEIPWSVANDAGAIKAYIETKGIKVYGLYEDGWHEAPVDAVLTVDLKTLKATYTFEGKSTQINLTRPNVVLEGIELSTTELEIPYATVKAGADAVKKYIMGKYTVTAKYNNGDTKDVTDKAIVAVNTETGEITVTYTEGTVSQTGKITIKRGDPLPAKIIVKQVEEKITEIEYCGNNEKLAEYVESLGLKAYTVYEDGREVEITDTYTLGDGELVWKDGELSVTVPIKTVHHMSRITSETPATTDEDGVKEYECDRCGAKWRVIIPKLNAEIEGINAGPSPLDVPYDIWNAEDDAISKIKGYIEENVQLVIKVKDGDPYASDGLIKEAKITVDMESKTAKIEFRDKETTIDLNFKPNPAEVKSIDVTPKTLTIAYADWYGKTNEALAEFIKATEGYKVTATKNDDSTEDVTAAATVEVTKGSNNSGTATVTYLGKTTEIALTFTAQDTDSGEIGVSGTNSRRPGGGGTFIPGGTVIIPTPSDSGIFKDLPKDHFAYDSVMALYNKGIVSGDGNNYIYPENGVTREEIAKIALTVNQIPEETGLEIDVADKGDVSAWAANIVATAMKKGILVGYGDGTIRPKQVVTREEMVAMFIRALGVQADSKNTNFSDVDAEAWSAAYVAAASDLGFVQGYEDGTFRPVNNITRAEAFVICYRIMQFRDTLTAAIAG